MTKCDEDVLHTERELLADKASVESSKSSSEKKLSQMGSAALRIETRESKNSKNRQDLSNKLIIRKVRFIDPVRTPGLRNENVIDLEEEPSLELGEGIKSLGGSISNESK